MKFVIAVLMITPPVIFAQEGTIKSVKSINEPFSTGSVIQITTALLIVLGVIFVGAYLFRRYAKIANDGSGYLKIISAISVGPRERIIILKAGNKDLVVGIMPGRITALCELEDFKIIDRDKQVINSPHFSDRLNALLKKKEK